MTSSLKATTTVAHTLKHLAVPIGSLRPHPWNPRRGDLDAIKESLRHHGQYRPIVANRRTGEVLAGNHLLRAAKELGFEEIAVTFVDVSEEEAIRIVLVDNRTSDLAGYDDELLARRQAGSASSRSGSAASYRRSTTRASSSSSTAATGRPTCTCISRTRRRTPSHVAL